MTPQVQKASLHILYRFPISFFLLYFVGTAVVVWFLCGGIIYEITELVILAACMIPILSLFPLFAGLYGIFINQKRIWLISNSGIARYRYDNVRRLTVTITDCEISIQLLTVRNERRVFTWDGISFRTSRSLQIFADYAPIILTQKRVDLYIEKLSRCEKVKIIDLYEFDQKAPKHKKQKG